MIMFCIKCTKFRDRKASLMVTLEQYKTIIRNCLFFFTSRSRKAICNPTSRSWQNCFRLVSSFRLLRSWSRHFDPICPNMFLQILEKTRLDWFYGCVRYGNFALNRRGSVGFRHPSGFGCRQGSYAYERCMHGSRNFW